MLAFTLNAQDTQKSLLFTNPKVDHVFAMNTVKNTMSVTPMIDLNLSIPRKYRESNYLRETGLGIFLGGIAFTSAAILESGDFKIYQGETARQIMLGVGIGLTITGGLISIKN